ncbi:MAG: hypothetical protein ACO1O6_14905 [Bacteroidota bacterium]
MRTKTIIFSSAFVLFSPWSFSQGQAFHVEKESHPSELITYLFASYGPEASENILLKIQAFEKANDKKVLAAGAYRDMLEKLEAEIIQTEDPARIHELQARKNKFVPLADLEKQLR